MTADDQRALAWRIEQIKIAQGRIRAQKALIPPPEPRSQLLGAWQPVILACMDREFEEPLDDW